MLAFGSLEVTPLKWKLQYLILEVSSLDVGSDNYIWRVSPGWKKKIQLIMISIWMIVMIFWHYPCTLIGGNGYMGVGCFYGVGHLFGLCKLEMAPSCFIFIFLRPNLEYILLQYESIACSTTCSLVSNISDAKLLNTQVLFSCWTYLITGA